MEEALDANAFVAFAFGVLDPFHQVSCVLPADHFSFCHIAPVSPERGRPGETTPREPSVSRLAAARNDALQKAQRAEARTTVRRLFREV